MKQNPLIVWSLERVKRDPRGLAALLGFVLFFYGMVGLTVLSWSSSLPRRMEDFLTRWLEETYGHLVNQKNAFNLRLAPPPKSKKKQNEAKPVIKIGKPSSKTKGNVYFQKKKK